MLAAARWIAMHGFGSDARLWPSDFLLANLRLAPRAGAVSCCVMFCRLLFSGTSNHRPVGVGPQQCSLHSSVKYNAEASLGQPNH